jgi:CRP-like cAMP-binding protein
MSEKIRKLKEDAARLIAKGKLEEACECYEKVVKADNRDLTARQKLAEIYGRLGKTDRAVHIYQSVAGSYAADGLLLKAIAVCKIILQLDPSHTETQAILADLSTRRRGGSETVVEMPKAMSEALAGAKKSAATIRGVAASQIRGVPANEMRPATRPGDPIDLDVAVQPSPPSRSPTEPSHQAVQAQQQAQRAQAGVSLGRPAASSVEELSRAAAAMLPEGPPPLLAGIPVRMPPPPQDDLPIDVDIDDAEPVIIGSVDAPRPSLAGAPILSAAINAALPTFDELLDMVPGESALQQHAQALAAAVETGDGNDEVIIDDSGDDDDADIIDLQPEPAQIDVDKVPPIPLFSDLPRDAFVALTERMDLRVCGIDEPLIVEGEGGSAMFVIIQGRVKVVRDTEAGEVVLAELSDGTFFGEMALLSDAPRTASVICTEETMLFVISRDLLADMTSRYPSVGEVMKKFHKNRLITNLLKTSPIFAPFSTNDKKLLIEKFKSRQVDTGSYLITREKPGDGLYVVLSGRCEVLDQKDDGREVTIADLKEGDVFGEMSMLWNKETCASVRATTPCTVLRLPRGDFSEVIMTHPQILETLSTLSEKRQKQNLDQRSAGIVTEFLV